MASPKYFVIGQAIYGVKGMKLGWISCIELNAQGTPDLERITVTTPNGTPLYFTSNDLREGKIFTRNGLRVSSIQRQSPVVVFPGNRLFEGPVFRGWVVNVTSSEVFPTELVVQTNLGQSLGADLLNRGAVHVGKRKHAYATED